MSMTVRRVKDTRTKTVFMHKIADIRGGVSVKTSEIGGDNLILNSRCDKEIPALSTTGGYSKGSSVDLLISDEVTYNGNPTLKLEQNTPLIARQTWIQFDKYKMSDNKLDASKYVFSCMMYVPTTTPNPVHQDDYIGIRIYAGVSASSITTISYDLTKKGTWQKLTAIFENVDLLQESDTWLSFRISCNVSVANASIKAYVSEIQLVKGNKDTAWKPAPEDAQNELKDAIAAEEEARNAALADVSKEMAGLQEQIDGQIESWFESYDPTTINDPAKTWLDTNTEEAHMNDTFTNLETGASWRWGISPQTGTYAWLPIADTATQKALQEAAKAQSTADGKSTTYLSKPTSYSKGDLWILESDTAHTGDKKGDVLTANATRSSYKAADWSKKVRYTDDTAALLAQQNAEAAANAAKKAQTDANSANALLSDIANDNKLTPQEKQQAKKEWDAIVAEKPLNEASAKNYGINTTKYTNAYNKLESYLKPLLENLANTSDIKGSDFRNMFNVYYTERTNLLNAISSKAKQLADNAQTKADAANTLATQAKSAATAAQSAIDAMNNDSIFDVTEKQSIRTEWECISGNANTSTTTGGANGSYYKAFKMAERVGLAYGDLTTKFNALRTYLNGLALYTNSNTSGFSRTTLATNFANYYNAETALIAEVQKKIVDDVEIGGTNLAVCSTCVLINMTRDDYSFKQISADTRDLFQLQIAFINDNTFYASSIDKTIDVISKYSYEIKSSKVFNKIRIKANGLTKDTGVIFTGFTYEEGTTYIVSFEITNITQGSLSWKNVKIEKGNKPTAWSPAPEDVEAKVSELDYLKEALQGTTEIEGGLVLANVIGVRDTSNKVVAGLSGTGSGNEDAVFWTGATIAEMLKGNAVSQINKSGSGWFAKKKISWDKNGGLSVGIFSVEEGKVKIKSTEHTTVITEGDVEDEIPSTLVDKIYNGDQTFTLYKDGGDVAYKLAATSSDLKINVHRNGISLTGATGIYYLEGEVYLAARIRYASICPPSSYTQRVVFTNGNTQVLNQVLVKRPICYGAKTSYANNELGGYVFKTLPITGSFNIAAEFSYSALDITNSQYYDSVPIIILRNFRYYTANKYAVIGRNGFLIQTSKYSSFFITDNGRNVNIIAKGLIQYDAGNPYQYNELPSGALYIRVINGVKTICIK